MADPSARMPQVAGRRRLRGVAITAAAYAPAMTRLDPASNLPGKMGWRCHWLCLLLLAPTAVRAPSESKRMRHRGLLDPFTCWSDSAGYGLGLRGF